MRTVIVIGLIAIFGLRVCAQGIGSPGGPALIVKNSKLVEVVPSLPKHPIIAVCDPTKVFTEYKKATELGTALEQEITQTREQVQAMAQQITTQQTALDGLKKKRGDEYEKLVEQIATLKAEYGLFVKTKSTELDAKRTALLKSSLAEVYVAIEQVAKDKGVNLVLSRRADSETRGSVLYADDTLDITDAVAAELNKEVAADE